MKKIHNHSLNKKERRFIHFITKNMFKLRWFDFVAIFLSIFICSSVWMYFFKMEIYELNRKIDGYIMNVDMEPLGTMHITMYSHHETGSRYTASSYKLDPIKDSGRTCAVSRDLWQKDIIQGDILYIKELHIFLTVTDTMAINNPITKRPQKKWVDIYEADMDKVNAFGLRRLTVYKLRRP